MQKATFKYYKYLNKIEDIKISLNLNDFFYTYILHDIM